MEVFQYMVLCLGHIACVLMGYKMGRAARTIERPAPVMPAEPVEEPVEAVQEIPEQPEDKQSRFEAIMRNIDRYDGTAEGQEDVPWR